MGAGSGGVCARRRKDRKVMGLQLSHKIVGFALIQDKIDNPLLLKIGWDVDIAGGGNDNKSCTKKFGPDSLPWLQVVVGGGCGASCVVPAPSINNCPSPPRLKWAILS